jgi:hypothetical protein
MKIRIITTIIALSLFSVMPTWGQTAVIRRQTTDTKPSKTAGASRTRNNTSVSGGEYVDLGLPSGTLWATCNIGANKPEDYGDYLSWGALKGYKSGVKNFRNEYPWINNGQIIKYNYDSKRGKVDNKTELDPEDDVSYVKKGNGCRIPSYEQIQELMDNCTWKWTRLHGVKGCVVKGKNGNSIFLPAGGVRIGSCYSSIGSCGYYWSRSLSKKYPSYALCCDFDSDNPEWINSDGGMEREAAMSIRPIRMRK